jgi:hypothetical protein
VKAKPQMGLHMRAQDLDAGQNVVGQHAYLSGSEECCTIHSLEYLSSGVVEVVLLHALNASLQSSCWSCDIHTPQEKGVTIHKSTDAC